MAWRVWHVCPVHRERTRHSAELAKLLSMMLHNSDVLCGEHAHR